jgi:hypothetical protein
VYNYFGLQTPIFFHNFPLLVTIVCNFVYTSVSQLLLNYYTILVNVLFHHNFRTLLFYKNASFTYFYCYSFHFPKYLTFLFNPTHPVVYVSPPPPLMSQCVPMDLSHVRVFPTILTLHYALSAFLFVFSSSSHKHHLLMSLVPPLLFSKTNHGRSLLPSIRPLDSKFQPLPSFLTLDDYVIIPIF